MKRLKILLRLLPLTLAAALTASLAPSHAQDTPWKRRLRKGVVLSDAPAARRASEKGPLTADEMRRLGLRPRGAGLLDLSRWPEEPPATARVSASDLARAMAGLCPASVDTAELEVYAAAIVRYSAQFEVDPWLLAALVYTQSDCAPDIDNSYGTGLTLINRGMHRRHVREGEYRFAEWTKRGWQRSTLELGAFPFTREALRDPEANLYFAAALMHVFRKQCPALDEGFDSEPHRHAVSHFVWGDRVGDAGPEDRILTARRRLLHSHAELRGNRGSIAGIALLSPLDGSPRVAISGLGEPRDHGRRPHRGIDFASERGEPVRTVAAGTVTFAGVDWERRAHIALEPWGAAIVHPRHMGPRGLFVEIDHGNGVVSLYAHLERYDVKVGERVEAGQALGEVGGTGVRDSGPHLHFGLFHHGEVVDPLDHLGPYVFPPRLTERGRAELAKKHRRKRRRR